MIPNILSIAGTDCTGGAGIQADIKAISANGGFAMSVITAVVAQNTTGVQKVEMMPIDLVEAQLKSVFSDVRVDAVKIGMLGTPEMTECVVRAIKKYRPDKIVLDPVMVAKSGDRLLEEQAVVALRDNLIPLVGLITPNLPEAADLLGQTEARSQADMLMQAKALNCDVFLKGGHLNQSGSPDLLLTSQIEQWFDAKRIDTQNTHGTGCTLSATIATNWAKEGDIRLACSKAKQYLNNALLHADELDIGQGQGPVNHFWFL